MKHPSSTDLPDAPAASSGTMQAHLERARAALTRDLAPTPAARQAILRARAAALAEDRIGGETAQLALDVLEFRLADETYAVASAYVREVYPVRELTPLPCTPAFVRGIMNVRGQIVSVIDLRTLFDLPGNAPAAMQRAIILRAGAMEVAILADTVLGVRALGPEEIQPAPAMLTGGCAPYLHGVTADRVAILDAAKLLADDKIVVNDEVDN